MPCTLSGSALPSTLNSATFTLCKCDSVYRTIQQVRITKMLDTVLNQEKKNHICNKP